MEQPGEAQPEQGSTWQQAVGNADRYCRGCRYCLGDLTADEAPDVCPECGRAFDKTDPKATLLSPRKQKPLLLQWPVIGALVVMALVFIGQVGLMPVPVVGTGGSLWQWRYQRYGYNDGLWWWRSRAYGVQVEKRNGIEFQIDLHAGIASKVVAVSEADRRHVFTIERAGDPPVWSLRVDDHDLAWPIGQNPELIRAMNFTREHRFGVSIYPPRDSTRLTPDGPIVASGTEADVFWAYVRAYGLEVDLPERVPPTSDGWHPTLPEGATVEYPRAPEAPEDQQIRTIYRGR